MSTATSQIRLDKRPKKESDPFYSRANQSVLKKSIRQLEAGKGKTRTRKREYSMAMSKIFLAFYVLITVTGCNRGTSRTPPVVPPGISWYSLLSDATELKVLARPVDQNTSSRMFSSCSETGKVMLANLAPKVTGDLDHGFFTEVLDTPKGVLATIGEFDGPGVVTWVWSANPTGTLLIYIDKQEKPALNIPFADF